MVHEDFPLRTKFERNPHQKFWQIWDNHSCYSIDIIHKTNSISRSFSEPLQSFTQSSYKKNKQCNVVQKISILSPPELALIIATLVESRHWFISWSYLNLHEECFTKTAFRTCCFCTVNIFPCLLSTKYIIYLLFFQLKFLANLAFNRKYIWASGAEKTQALTHIRMLNL